MTGRMVAAIVSFLKVEFNGIDACETASGSWR